MDMDDAKVQMLMRQTTLSYDEVCAQLVEYKQDEMRVLRAYLAPKPNAVFTPDTAVCPSINQHIYKEIRSMMDAAAKTYKNRQ
jgi:hypothetical protein